MFKDMEPNGSRECRYSTPLHELMNRSPDAARSTHPSLEEVRLVSNEIAMPNDQLTIETFCKSALQK